jgi:hypothetical protein
MKHIPQLDGIRAYAILGVFLYHSPLHFKGGWAGVDLFCSIRILDHADSCEPPGNANQAIFWHFLYA